MSKVYRKISAALLVFTMLFAFCITPPVLAAEPTTFTENNIKYKVTDSANHYVEVVNPSYTKDPFFNPPKSTYSGDITIPLTVNHDGQDYTVKGLGYAAFIDADITSISLPSGLEYIESAALANTNLTTVTIPATVTRLGSSTSVFGNSQGTPNKTLTTINFEDGSQLQALKGYTFAHCPALTKLEIPSGVTTVDAQIFSGCSALETVELPAGITKNVGNALEGYPNAKDVTFAEGSPYAIDGGVLYNGSLLEKQLDKALTSVTVREGTTEIADKAFYLGIYSNLATVSLPDSVTKIGKEAFFNTKITAIDLSHVNTIGQSAFKSCSALATVQWPTNITELELATFQNCTSLTTVDLPDTLTTLGKNVFRDCTALTTVEFPTSLTTLGESAFVNCTSLKQVKIPEGVSEIPKQTFAKCIGLEAITLPKGLTTIGEQAFFLNIKESGKWTNPDPKLTAINIPASVTSVGKNFLAGVQADGKTALIFEGAQPPTFATGALAGISGDSANKPTVYYPAEAKDAYTETTGDLVTNGLVTKPSEGNPPDTQYALAIDEESLSLKEGDTKALTVTSTLPKGATLEWASSNEAVATVQDGTVTAVKEGTATISASMILNGVTLVTDTCTVTVTPKSSGGGGGTVVKRYDVTLADCDNGSITATHKRAAKNATITLTAIPDEGYEVDAVIVTNKNGKAITVTDKGNNKYTFTMPASNVTVKATFAKDGASQPEQPSGFPFVDVAKTAWYFPAVEYVYNNNLMNGTTLNFFAPNVELNRAMMAAVLYNMEGGPACDKTGLFSDVENGKWYTDAVNWAASNNIVSGMPDGTYAPNQALTREQMASILYRYAKFKGIDTSARADLSTFTDGTTVSPWAQDVAQWAVAEKLMNGVGSQLQPKGTATRAQVATVLMNYCENVTK